MKVKEFMTSGMLQFCSPETKLNDAAKAMKKGNCGALPVINNDKKVIGIVTDRDICLSLANKQEKPLPQQNVGDIISSKIIAVEDDADLSTALMEMRINRIGRLPVTDKSGRLKGMLSVHDLLSKSMNGNVALGSVTSDEETIAKTVKSLADSYSFQVITSVETAE